MQKLNNTVLNKQKDQRNIGKYFETNEHENITYKNIWDKAKTVFGGEFIVANAYTEERSHINNLTYHPKEL